MQTSLPLVGRDASLGQIHPNASPSEHPLKSYRLKSRLFGILSIQTQWEQS